MLNAKWQKTMRSSRLIMGIAVCLAALFSGCIIGLAMGGFGICAVGFSGSLVGASAVVAALFGGSLACLWPKAWWVGGLAFSVPTLLGLSFAASGGDWQRVVGIGLCIAAAMLAAFVIRYPGPRGERP